MIVEATEEDGDAPVSVNAASLARRRARMWTDKQGCIGLCAGHDYNDRCTVQSLPTQIKNRNKTNDMADVYYIYIYVTGNP